MAIELSTAGITLKYCLSATGSATRPTTGFTAINGVKSLPEINPEPATIDCTPLAETSYHKYIAGLKDFGGSIGITVNDYADFRTSWEALLTAYSGKTDSQEMWFEIAVPDMTKSFYFSGEPSALGFGGAEVDAVLENVAYIVPHTVSGWDTAST